MMTKDYMKQKYSNEKGEATKVYEQVPNAAKNEDSEVLSIQVVAAGLLRAL